MDSHDWLPSATLNVLKDRATVNQMIRQFFQQRGVLEVETPALSQSGNTDPAIQSFVVKTPQGSRYLHTSPEYPMKRLLASGSGDIYQLGKVWRQEESGARHNPEFTMLEWYRVGFSLAQLLEEVDALLQQVIPRLKTSQFISYRTLFLEKLGIDPHIASQAVLSACAKAQGINIREELSTQAWLDLLLSHCLEPQFPSDRLTYLYDYPHQHCALAQQYEVDGQIVAKRCEVYLGTIELGNAYQELISAEHNRKVLQQDALRHPQAIPVDERFLAATLAGMPASAGIAIGVDRLLLCRMPNKDLKQIISFTWEVA